MFAFLRVYRYKNVDHSTVVKNKADETVMEQTKNLKNFVPTLVSSSRMVLHGFIKNINIESSNDEFEAVSPLY